MRLISRRSFVSGAAGASAVAVLPWQRALGKSRGWVLHKYMRDIHSWYGREFFDFDRNFSAEERRFIQECVRATDSRANKITNNFFYSTCSYSHRVHGRNVNSRRLGYGSLKHRKRIQPALAAAVRQRGIDPASIPHIEDAWGLGWDFGEGHFKVYIHLNDLRKLRDRDVIRLGRKIGSERAHNFGLVAYTFDGRKMFEKKLYLAMRDKLPKYARKLPFANLVTHTNYMITDRRGIVPQVDLEPGTFSKRYLNGSGSEVCRRYEAQVGRVFTFEDTRVDTIAYRNRDEYTLYF